MTAHVDDRTPVIVGVAQQTWHATAEELAPEPAVMMADTLRAAAANAGSARLLERATGLWTLDLASWRYESVPVAVAARLGIAPPHTLASALGGEQPQVLFGRAAAAIAAGAHEVILVTGAEAFRTRRIARASGQQLDIWRPDAPLGVGAFVPDRDPSHPAEAAAGARIPTDYYPMFDTALRGAAGRSLGEHRTLIGQVWSDFARVAADNPHANLRSAPGLAEITEPSAKNRMVSFPYTKLMTSNIFVDQSASVILCSARTATDLGIPRDRWVFPTAAASAEDLWFVSDRTHLDRCPPIQANAESAFRAAGVGIDEVAHFDLYSCFPSAVLLATQELGLPATGGDRALTSTGGLTFAGGPGSNYSTHGLVALVERLRTDTGSLGMLTGVGMFTTKHSLGLYSTEPRGQFRLTELGTVADAGRPTRTDFAGSARLETYVVRHGDDGQPESSVLAAITDAGERVWASSKDADALDRLEREELLGTAIRVDGITAHLA